MSGAPQTPSTLTSTAGCGRAGVRAGRCNSVERRHDARAGGHAGGAPVPPEQDGITDPARIAASMSLGLSPTSTERARSRPRSSRARSIMPGLGFRSNDSRRVAPDAVLGVIRTEIDGVDIGATARELLARPRRQLVKLLFGVVAARDACLIRDNHDRISRPAKRMRTNGVNEVRTRRLRACERTRGRR